MTWIRLTVKSVHLVVLLLVCGLGLYQLNVTSQTLPSMTENEIDKEDEKVKALTVVQDGDQREQTDDIVVESEDEIHIENHEPFIPTNEWQLIKPGQAIPRGLHVRLNLQTGQKEARLLQKEDDSADDDAGQQSQGASEKVGDKLNLDEVKKAVKSMKSESFRSVDMETLRKERQFRSYEELKADMEKMNVEIQTDAEIITQLVERFQAAAQAQGDLTPLLEQLEYYLHQIDNAMLFCDLGAMPVLLRCLNSSVETVRSEAALVLGSALQSNPKVQIVALENGAMYEVLRLIAFDHSKTVRKRALYALSTMVRHFPFAQKRFLQLGGLSVLGKLFEGDVADYLQVRAVTLLTDLVREKELNSVHSSAEDSAQEERLHQYREIGLQEAMVESGWCSFVSSLLTVPEHDSREKVLVAMDTLLPACRAWLQSSTPALKTLEQEYRDLVVEERNEAPEVEDDGFYQSLVTRIEVILGKLSVKEEL